MKKFHSGVQLYSIKDEVAADFEGALKKVAEIGYEYVEFAGDYGGHSAGEIKTLLAKYSLKCISAHCGAESIDQALLDFFKVIGVKYVTIPWYDPNNFRDAEKREQLLKEFSKAAKLVKENGMVLQYHNHEFEFGKLDDGRYYLDWLFDSIPELEVQLDVCWVLYAGADPIEYINKYAHRMKTIHFKDFSADKLGFSDTVKFPKEDNGFMYRPMGRGIQDFDAIIAALEKTCVEYLIVEEEQEDCYEVPPVEAITISREYLRNKGI